MTMLTSTVALAGPPFRTGDPEPTDYRHWEIYLFSEATHAKEGTEGVLPGFEANYGLLPEVQLSVEAPYTFNKVSGEKTRSGYGDSEIAVKYRFIQEDKNGWQPQVGIHPAWVIPTGDADKGLGSGHSREYLPVLLQKSRGPWTTYGGGGYWINPGEGNRNYWFFGWALMKKMTENLSLGGEIFHQTADTVEGTASSGFNLGSIYDITENHHLVFSAGRGIGHASEINKFSYYAGYEITF